MGLADEIERLEKLRQSGVLSETEFYQAKSQLLSGQTDPSQSSGGFSFPIGRSLGMDENSWCMLMHLSQLLNYTGAGILVPIVLWLVSKDRSEKANLHGIEIINFTISWLIYVLAASILTMAIIGIPILILLAILGVAFPVIGGIQAYSGKLWRYPMTISFIKPVGTQPTTSEFDSGTFAG
ncbi:MAG: DUF4870 domain-containing protein [Planctomycetaceae bacterium]|nr:DUF4870 domain-containing protein [Planctomycetaceae bacterium]